MKKYRISAVLLSLLLLATLLATGCGTILVTKDGEVDIGEPETREYEITGFTRVAIGSAFTYEIKQADVYSVSITANSNLFDDIDVSKSGQTLNIGMEFPGITWTPFMTSPYLKAVITLPQLQELDSSGATNGTVTGFSSAEDLDITASGASTVILEEIAAGNTSFDISGASTVTGNIAAEDIRFVVSGASTVELKGSAGNLDADASGASNLELAGLTVGDADVTLSGASHGDINLDGRLDVGLSGASTLEYEGQPYLGSMDMTGASTLQEK